MFAVKIAYPRTKFSVLHKIIIFFILLPKVGSRKPDEDRKQLFYGPSIKYVRLHSEIPDPRAPLYALLLDPQTPIFSVRTLWMAPY